MTDATVSADKKEIEICIPAARPDKALTPVKGGEMRWFSIQTGA
jgi:hypothetical protein